MANDALDVNSPYPSAEHITTHGSDWLWAAFAIMLFSDLIVIGWHFMIPRGQRIFHQIGMVILTTATIAYFCLASDLGFASIATEFTHLGFPAGTLRQIWYVRYIDWVVTTPALLLELVLASGLPLSDIITLIFFDLVMIITGLVGALVKSSYKWGFYAFGNMALFYIWWVLFGPARSTAGVIGAEYKKSFTVSAGILSFLWLGYPIAWGLADGGSYITPDSEMIFYGILDVIAKPVFLFIHLFMLSKLDLTALQLSSGKFSASAVGAAPYDHEKSARHTVVENPPRQSAAANAAANAGVPTKEKKGMFSKKGKYDATPVAADTYSRDGAAHNVAVGRPSEGTVVSERA